jgi:hypothetical protein
MAAYLEGPITVLSAVITVRESALPTWATVALSMLCILLVGFALRGEFSLAWRRLTRRDIWSNRSTPSR